MKRIPPDVERLMWLVAEQGDLKAIAEFEARFPDLKVDLSKRLSMIRGLKGAKRDAVATPAIPRFRPVQRPTAPSGAPKLAWVTAAVALAAIAVASFTFTNSLLNDKREVQVTPKVEIPKVVAPPRTQVDSTQDRQWPNSVQNDQGTPRAPRVDDSVSPEQPEHLKPIKIDIKGAPLKVVLLAIQEKSGIKLDVGPGMPDPTVDIEYDGKNALEILQDLGAKYGFTPFDQGNGSIVVVPATDAGTDSNSRHVGP
jgi:hypothetical protein